MKKLLLVILSLCILQVSVFSQKIHLQESFDNNIFPPDGWSIEDPYISILPRWNLSHSYFADGQYHELKFTTAGSEDFRFISPLIDIKDCNNLYLSFRQMLNTVTNSLGEEVNLQIRTESGDWATVWTQKLDSYVNNKVSEQIDIKLIEQDVIDGKFQFCFYANAKYLSINNWYIDNIVLYSNLDKDISVKSIESENHWINGEPFIPKLKIYNNGVSVTEKVPVSFTISNFQDNQIYSEIVDVNFIESDSELEIEFPEISLPENNQMYKIVAQIQYEDDNIVNNSAQKYIDNYTLGRQFILKEFSTGLWCQYCPKAAQALEQMENDGIYKMAVVEYHNGDKYASSNSENRLMNYYQTTVYPSNYTNGKAYGYTYNGQVAAYNEEAKFGSALKLYISGTNIQANEYSISINVSKHLPFVDDYTILHLVLTESNISEEWYGEEFVHYVQHEMYPNYNGTRIDLINNDQYKKDYTITLKNEWVAEECELVAFVQNRFTGEVYQATMEHLTKLPLQAPEITFSPLNGSVNIPINYEFKLKSNVPLRKQDDAELTNDNISDIVKILDEQGKDILFEATINNEKTIISIKSVNPLNYISKYKIIISDFENTDDIPGVNTEMFFETQKEISVPYVTFNPENNATSVSINNPVEISFSQTVRLLNDSQITSDDIQNIVTFKQAETDIEFIGIINSSNDKITLLPKKKLGSNLNYKITIMDVENSHDLAIGIQSTNFTTELIENISLSKKEKYVKLYPNPTNDILNITLHNSNIQLLEIMDLSGKIFIKQQYNKLIIKNIALDISYLEKGSYLIRLLYPNKTIVRKIIKL